MLSSMIDAPDDQAATSLATVKPELPPTSQTHCVRLARVTFSSGFGEDVGYRLSCREEIVRGARLTVSS